MKTRRTQNLIAAALVYALASASAYAQTINTRLGKLEVESGYPSKESIAKLTDEIDYQRACQAYVWGLPIVGLTEWQRTHDNIYKVRNGQLVIFLSFEQKLGIMTPNFDTPYIAALADLEKSGPLVFELPKGLMAGMVIDAWQRSLSDVGVVGPDKGQGGKYLILGPGQEDPKEEGYIVIRSTTTSVFFGVRLLDPDRDRAIRELVPQMRTYAWSARESAQRAGGAGQQRQVEPDPADRHGLLGKSGAGARP